MMSPQSAIVICIIVILLGDSSVAGDPLSNLFVKLFKGCESKQYGLVNCLKAKSILLLDRASRSDLIKLDESISIVRESDRSEQSRSLSENEIESSLSGSDTVNVGRKLNEMLMDKAISFFNTHVVKIGFPKFETKDGTRSLEEGRGKMKRTMGMLMTMIMMKAMMMIPLSIGTLFLLAGKALIISKIALVLSLLITLKKLLSKPTEHVVHETHGYAAPSDSGGWDRKFQNAHNLAYSAYVTHQTH